MNISKVMFIFCCIILLLYPTADVHALSLYTDQYYYIVSSLDKNMVIDVSGGGNQDSTNIQLYERNGTDAQLFKLVSAGNGYFYIVNKGSEKVLDVEGGGTASQTNVQLYTKNNTDAQQWKLYMAYGSDKYVSFQAKCGKFLDVSGGNAKNGTNIWIYDGNNTASQAFELVSYANTEYQTVTLDFYDIQSWIDQVEMAQRSLTFGGSMVTNPSGKTYYNGKIITGATVLETKTLNVKIPLQGPGDYYTYKTISFPSKIQYKLHKHNNDVKLFFDISHLHMWQQCECGYRDEWTWEVPWPDTSDAQTTQSINNAIRPVWTPLWNVH